MGVKKFGEFVDRYCPAAKGEVDINCLTGTTIAIDGSNAFYALYCIAFKTLVAKSDNIMGTEIDQTKLCSRWMISVIEFLCRFLSVSCTPIIVFDGLEKPIDKLATERRREVRKKAINRYDKFKESLSPQCFTFPLGTEYPASPTGTEGIESLKDHKGPVSPTEPKSHEGSASPTGTEGIESLKDHKGPVCPTGIEGPTSSISCGPKGQCDPSLPKQPCSYCGDIAVCVRCRTCDTCGRLILDTRSHIEIREEAKKLRLQTLELNPTHIQLLYDVLYHLGFPVVRSVGDGERLCVALCRDGYANSVFTTDTDAIILGSPFTFRTGKNPGKLQYYELSTILSTIGYTRRELADLAILLGCDYNEGISGIGVVKGYSLMTKYRSLENIPDSRVSNLNIDVCRKFFNISEHSWDLISSHELTKDTIGFAITMNSVGEESYEFLHDIGMERYIGVVETLMNKGQ